MRPYHSLGLAAIEGSSRTMGIAHHIDVDRGVIFIKVDGELRDESVGWWSDAILEDPNYRPGMDRLADYSGLTKLSVTTEGLRRLATAARGFDPLRWGDRLAIVVSGDVGLGVARQYQAMRMESPYEIRLFRNVEEAKEWLAIPPDYEPWPEHQSPSRPSPPRSG